MDDQVFNLLRNLAARLLEIGESQITAGNKEEGMKNIYASTCISIMLISDNKKILQDYLAYAIQFAKKYNFPIPSLKNF